MNLPATWHNGGVYVVEQARQAIETFNRRSASGNGNASWNDVAWELAGVLEGDLPLPLEEIPAPALLSCIERAHQSDEWDQTAQLGDAAWGALRYEIAATLGPGPLRESLIRKVEEHWQRASCVEFVFVAERMALSTPGRLLDPAIASRVGLAFALGRLHGDADVRDLGFYMVCHPALFMRWIEEPSLGAIPNRRLAGLIMAEAALGIQARVERGRDWVSRVWSRDAFQLTLRGLLADREPLVWRHAAVARGRLVACQAELRTSLEYDLAHPEWGTPWRRALAFNGGGSTGDARLGLASPL